MKKIITKSLVIIFSIGMAATALLNLFLQVHLNKKQFQEITKEHFWQIEHILEENEEELSEAKKEFAEDCVARARAAAYISRHFPDMVENQKECEKVANLLQIDELHFFTADGVIYAGTHPEYYGYNFSSGEQMAFFAPMLEDYSLELCQDIMPNTAEQKLMQYAAVWSRDHKRIVQVGLKPERIIKEIEGNAISKIFPKITADTSSVFFAVDMESEKVLGSTNHNFIGKNIEEVGFNYKETEKELTWMMAVVEGEQKYCAMKKADSILLIKMIPVSKLYEGILTNTALLCCYCFLLFLVITVAIYIFLDRKIIRSIVNINGKLKEIEQGSWDTVLFEDSTFEFTELSAYINSMVGSLLNFSRKVSKALELSGVPIGICEYAPDSNRFMVSGRVKDILMLTEEEFQGFEENPKLFLQKIEEICREEAHIEGKIYRLEGSVERDIRVETFDYQRSRITILMDVTAVVQEKIRMAEERDRDLLTGLYNRRAFEREMNKLFAHPEKIKEALIIEIDMDKLKMVNDVYGHESGDRYLKHLADHLLCLENRKANRFAARMGGDEFVFIAYGLENEDEILAVIDEMLSCRENQEVTMENGEKVALEYSVGWVCYPSEGADFMELVRTADKRMYGEKVRRKGKNKEEKE